MDVLMEILSLKRPHGGTGEAYVADNILPRLPGALSVYHNRNGDPMAYVYCTDEASKTLFTAHLDTVHRDDGPNPVLYDPDFGWMSKADGQCLGADDGAGVWLLYKMAEAGVPGTYLFTVGEERGGIGARWMADNAADFLGKFDRAVAFDRKGTGSVITEQSWGRCCSDEFAEALSAAFNAGDIGRTYLFAPDDTGIYTDTAEFVTIIPECTNISVGYYNEHTGSETLDTGYLQELLSQCMAIDWSALPTVRDPEVVESRWGAYDAYEFGGGLGYGIGGLTLDDLRHMTVTEIDELVMEEPSAVADLLFELANFRDG